jgi:hypothetical protein
MKRIRETTGLVVAGTRSSISLLTFAGLVIGASALLGLGWGGAPIRLHAPGAAVWAVVAGVLGLVDLRRQPPGSERRLLAGTAVAVAVVALVTSLVVVVSFVPCGGACLR